MHRAGAEGQREKSCTTKGISSFSAGPTELRQPLRGERGLSPSTWHGSHSPGCTPALSRNGSPPGPCVWGAPRRRRSAHSAGRGGAERRTVVGAVEGTKPVAAAGRPGEDRGSQREQETLPRAGGDQTQELLRLLPGHPRALSNPHHCKSREESRTPRREESEEGSGHWSRCWRDIMKEKQQLGRLSGGLGGRSKEPGCGVSTGGGRKASL